VAQELLREDRVLAEYIISFLKAYLSVGAIAMVQFLISSLSFSLSLSLSLASARPSPLASILSATRGRP